MNRLRDPRWSLILAFLAVIGGVPAVQLAIEAVRDDRFRVFDIVSQVPSAPNLRAYEHGLEEANWAARASRPWMQFAQFEWLRDGGSKAIIGQDGWYFYTPGLNYLLTRPSPTLRSGTTNDPLPAILDFRDQLAQRGIRLILMPAPNKESVYPDRLTPRSASLRAVMAPRTREVLDRLRAAGVEVIDLFELFARARAEDNPEAETPLYLAQDTHWSPAGVTLAAREAARRLLELGWVRQGQVRYDERPAPIQRLGDVLRMLQVPTISQHIAPEAVPTLQIIRSDSGEPYTDAAEAEILVLGDSFMRIYQQDEPGSAGFVAHLARELRQPLMALVNDGGGSTLVRRELRARPAFLRNKSVVLWEFVERDIGLGVQGWSLEPLPPELPAPAP
ncbi:MAG: hypothetical protein KF833_01095 [Verrucomicrobiae bacterium]|nr:hypothetical protein [Verrucomicrobiae bacterium]